MVEAVLAWHSRRDQAPVGAITGGSTSAAGQRMKADP
jgi:hypothetical protein